MTQARGDTFRTGVRSAAPQLSLGLSGGGGGDADHRRPGARPLVALGRKLRVASAERRPARCLGARRRPTVSVAAANASLSAGSHARAATKRAECHITRSLGTHNVLNCNRVHRASAPTTIDDDHHQLPPAASHQPPTTALIRRRKPKSNNSIASLVFRSLAWLLAARFRRH